MAKKNPEACSRGSLHTEIDGFHYCCKKDKIRKRRQMLEWDMNDSWPAVLPDWISLKYENEGGGGPCAPTFIDVTVNLPPYAPNPMCCKK